MPSLLSHINVLLESIHRTETVIPADMALFGHLLTYLGFIAMLPMYVHCFVRSDIANNESRCYSLKFQCLSSLIDAPLLTTQDALLHMSGTLIWVAKVVTTNTPWLLRPRHGFFVGTIFLPSGFQHASLSGSLSLWFYAL